MRRIGRFVVIFLSTVGALAVLLIGLSLWGVSRVAQSGYVSEALPNKMVLTLDLERSFKQSDTENPLARLTEGSAYSLPKVAAGITKAASDPAVVGLYATLGASTLGMAGVQELRDAIATFKASGKPTFVFSESMGESGNGTLAYYLASAFGQIWLQPSGEVALQGFMAEGPYIKGFLDFVGVQPEFSGRYEYKSAIETFTEKGMSAAHRENLGALLDSWMTQVVSAIAQSRKMDQRKATALVGAGPFLAQEALSAGLVDQLGYKDEAEKAVDGATDEAERIDIATYAQTLHHHGTGIAVITGAGTIQKGKKSGPLSSDSDEFSSDTVAQAFEDAVDDDQVKAIVFRVDSPGGSYTASDTVWREVVLSRAAGKPVVVSMGDVAASGGYFVGMAADKVIAEPGTITGSIGVFTGKFVLTDLWTKLGINWDGMTRGQNAGMWSANHALTPAQWDRVNQVLDQIYKDFTTKAMEGRKIPADQIDHLARGRIWSGSDALRFGLINQLGGFETALDSVREILKLAPDAQLKLIAYPKPQTPFEMIQSVMDEGVSDHIALRELSSSLGMVKPFLSQLGLRTQGGTLEIAPP